MGLLRLMGNKADVVKGLAKRCNEQWLIAPKSDIVRMRTLKAGVAADRVGLVSLRHPRPSDHHDPELKSL